MRAFEHTLQTGREGFVDITATVRRAVADAGVTSGICVVFCAHTTGAITINENADPTVLDDLLYSLSKISPDRPEFRHLEGNSAAHVKSSLVGASETLLVEDGRLVLGTWQSVFFCEFDGPRTRRFFIKVIADE
jgi:secondary thiamine-phosphate synthase enzyme